MPHKRKNTAPISFSPYRVTIRKGRRPNGEKNFASARKMIAWLRENTPEKDEEYDLRGVDFSGQDLSGIHLARCTLGYADLTGANLSGAMLDKVKLIHTKLDGADMTGAMLNEVNARYAEMDNLILTNATVRESMFVEAQMNNAKADGTSFSRVSFNHTQAAGSDFRGASFDIVEFISANLDGTDFRAVTQANKITADMTSMVDAKVSPEVGAQFAGQKLYDARVSPASMRRGRRRSRKLTL